jgi:hypothetical protein
VPAKRTAALSPGDVQWVVWNFYNEVYNGGLAQFITNSSGEHVPDICEALRLVDAPQLVPFVQSAIEIVGPNTAWGDQMARWQAVHDLVPEAKSRLWALDSEINPHLDALVALMDAYSRMYDLDSIDF